MYHIAILGATSVGFGDVALSTDTRRSLQRRNLAILPNNIWVLWSPAKVILKAAASKVVVEAIQKYIETLRLFL